MRKTKEPLFFSNQAPHMLADGWHYDYDISDTHAVRNPATGRTIGNVPKSFPTNCNIDHIGQAARAAQECWHWDVQEQEKEAVFRAIIAQFEKNTGPIARTITLESGKLWKWSSAEMQEAIDTLWHYHGEISRSYTCDGFSRTQLPDKNAFSVRIPYGIILKISPWNFPLAIPMWAICGALAGGNAIVLKPAKQTPFTAAFAVMLVRDAIKKVICDKRFSRLAGLVQLIQGSGETSGKLLLEKLDYDKATFTGSGAVGKMVAATASLRLKPCHLELGGHAAMVVLDDFDVDLAVAEAITANLGDSGQRCVSTRAVFVHESRYKEFVEKYIQAAQARHIGNPMDYRTEMGPVVSAEQLKHIHEIVRATENQLGKKARLGGYPINKEFLSLALAQGFNNVDETAIVKRGYYYAPTVFTEIPYGTAAMDEEIFGPVVVINPLSGDTREKAFWNAVELVNASPYGLSNAILTNDRRFSSRSPGRFKTGILYIGRGTTGAELNKYFGGVKASGWGREGKGLDDWTQIQQVYDDFHGKTRMAQSGADAGTQKIFSESRSPLE